VIEWQLTAPLTPYRMLPYSDRGGMRGSTIEGLWPVVLAD